MKKGEKKGGGDSWGKKAGHRKKRNRTPFPEEKDPVSTIIKMIVRKKRYGGSHKEGVNLYTFKKKQESGFNFVKRRKMRPPLPQRKKKGKGTGITAAATHGKKKEEGTT